MKTVNTVTISQLDRKIITKYEYHFDLKQNHKCVHKYAFPAEMNKIIQLPFNQKHALEKLQ